MDKWQALSTLLEAFGNSPTVMNGNATRFSQILSLDFDQAGQVASASVQVRGMQGGKRLAAWFPCLDSRLSPAPRFPEILPQRSGPQPQQGCPALPRASTFCPPAVPPALGGAWLGFLPILGWPTP